MENNDESFHRWRQTVWRGRKQPCVCEQALKQLCRATGCGLENIVYISHEVKLSSKSQIEASHHTFRKYAVTALQNCSVMFPAHPTKYWSTQEEHRFLSHSPLTDFNLYQWPTVDSKWYQAMWAGQRADNKNWSGIKDTGSRLGIRWLRHAPGDWDWL